MPPDDHDNWFEELRRKLDEMRRVLEEVGEARRRRRWAEDEPDAGIGRPPN